MDQMTVHNLKTQCQQMDEKVEELLSPEVQALYQTAYENALKKTTPKGNNKAGSAFKES